MPFRLQRIILPALLILSGCSGSYRSATLDSAQTPTVAMSDESISGPSVDVELLPLDPAVQTGVLPNGLRYMIRKNTRPENRAELRLVVNVGSILEDDDQLGLAHFVEHMAFNGTLHFEKQALVEYLESIGMRFGPDINAYTSFDETVYMLQVPTDSMDTLNKGFQILRDWSGDVTFDPEEIEKERGVVIEEWRTSRGASARLQDRQLPVILKDSRYAKRLPIGTSDILESFDPESLLRYYRDWYRPELMTVIAVGDFDPLEIEQRISELFSDLPASTGGRERAFYEVPEHEEVLYTIESDPEATQSLVRVMYQHEVWAQGTRKSYRDRLRSSIYSSMFNQRLSELTQSPDPPFIASASSDGSLVRTRDAYNLVALVKDGDFLRALHALLREAERVRRFGFTQTELDRTKTELLRGLEIAFNERDKTDSGVFASEYVNYILSKEASPGIAYEFTLAQELLPTISLDEVNELLSELVIEKNQVISISGPESDVQPLPSVAEVASVFSEVRVEDIEPYVDNVDDLPLLERIPTPGEIVAARFDSTLEATFMTLSNGVHIVLRATDFKNDQVLISATSPGGSSLASDEDFVSATFASSLVGSSGVGPFGPIELEKKLTGKAVQIGPVIGSLSEGFSGAASPQDLETLFQLIYLYGTEARADSVVYASLMTRYASLLSQRHSSPQTAFSDTLSTTLSQHHFRARPLTEELLAEISLSESYDFFRERYADFSDFTFYIVGAFDLATITPLLTTYIATLPALNRMESWKDSGIRTPPGVVKKTVVKGIEPQSRVAIIFSGDAEWSLQETNKMYVLEEVLSTRLREILREDLGGTYGVSVNGSLSDRPVPSYQVSISFGCAPNRVDELIGQVFAEIESLQQTFPEETYLQNARESALRDFEVGIRENGYWLSSLQFYLERGLHPAALLEGPAAWVDSITGEDVSAAARMYLNQNRFVQVTLVPEPSEQ